MLVYIINILSKDEIIEVDKKQFKHLNQTTNLTINYVRGNKFYDGVIVIDSNNQFNYFKEIELIKKQLGGK